MASLEQLVGGLGTGFLALLVLVVALLTTAASLLGVGLLLVPAVARILRSLADRERHRLGRFGVELLPPGPAPRRPREVLADRTVRRELAWLACHGTFGLLLGAVGVLLPLLAVRDLTFPLWWRVPPVEISATSLGIGVAHSWADAFAVSFLGVAWIVIILGASPHLAHAQAWFGGRLLAPDAETDLSLRIAELTSTRAAALDAHAVELRRIERSLHDGSQNRLVGVTVLLGAARRALERDPAAAGELLDRAQDAAEQALADLRAVARGILPPVLENRGLAGALTGLASECAVPCEAEIDVDGRCAASVEATAYFVVAEALTNVVKHSGASHATMTATLRDQRLHLEVTDDGQGGADTAGGSGLDGIRHRVEAYDGVLTLSSPKGGPTILAVELPCGS
jgi:signal transduction histidine kinase